MAEVLLLGLFHEATSTADTIDQLRRLGLPDEMITVMSGMPYRPEMLGRPRPQRRLGRISLLGALAGCLLGLFLPKPANLTGEAVQSLSDAEIFLVITQGRGLMPSLAENLSPVERWDVINYVRSLKK